MEHEPLLQFRIGTGGRGAGRFQIPLFGVPAACLGTVVRRDAPGHSPPRDGGKGVPPQTGLGEIPLYRLKKPQRGGVITVAGGIAVFA